MSAPKDPLSYPDHWFEALRRVRDGQTVDVPVLNRSQAKMLSLEWYGFRNALARDSNFSDLARQSKQVRCVTNISGLFRLEPTQQSKTAKLLESVLGSPESTSVPASPTPDQSSEFVDNDTVVLFKKYK